MVAHATTIRGATAIWLAAFSICATADPRELEPRQAIPSANPYSLPGNNSQAQARAAAITIKRSTFLYGPAVGGSGPYSPSGPLGAAYLANASVPFDSELAAQEVVSRNDSSKDQADNAANPLITLDDYVQLYRNHEWAGSSAPTGIAPGMLTNYTQDLLFSMERLSVNPYSLRRLIPGQDTLPFNVDARNVSGQTLSSLFSQGRLFYVDHRNQANLTRTALYAAACDAYFYIAQSGNFLPLAIRTNVGSNLIYTPGDAPNDWLLAKIMFNVNDFFMGQFHHLANTHYVAEIVYESAIRTLSDDHPVLAILARLLYGEFPIRPNALATLFTPGTDIDRFFPFTGLSAASYSSSIYFSGYAGSVQKNYFLTNLARRGLVGSSVGPVLKSFPFLEDAGIVVGAIRLFMGDFVNSYYANSSVVQKDTELQKWVAEASGPAQVIDFPTLSTPSQLADLLTHIAHLVSSAHHSVNLNQLLTTSGVLPLHPFALYKPVPASKGATNLAQYLPPAAQVFSEIELAAAFAKPLLAGTNRTLVHMFDDAQMLARMNSQTQAANQRFMKQMMARSQVVKSRQFNRQGLSQGMPFVWQALDPNVAPWSLTI